MFKKHYKFAERIVEVNSIFEAVHDYCKGYETDENADFSIEISQADIDFEREKSKREFAFEHLKYPEYPDEQLEITAVYRKIADIMPNYDTIVFHGSVIAVDGKAFLFTAKSGTGKSTHTRLWRELLGDRAVMVNDDKPLLCITDTGVIAYGTPYNGKHRLGCNMNVPLKGLCILTRASENSIRHITKFEAYSMLMQQVYRPQDGVQLKKVLTLIDKLAQNTELYQLGCNMEPEAARVAYEAMKGETL